MATRKQVTANRENAKKSTGPKTDEGKRVSSANAAKHWLTSSLLLCPGESQQDFDEMASELRMFINTSSPLVSLLLDRFIAVNWRLRRVQLAEAQLIQTYSDDQTSKPKGAFFSAYKGESARAILNQAQILEKQMLKLFSELKVYIPSEPNGVSAIYMGEELLDPE